MWNDKPDGYPIPAQNPMSTGTNFYPQVWIQVRISTRSLFAGGRVIALPDSNPTHCHPYFDLTLRIRSRAGTTPPVSRATPRRHVGINHLLVARSSG
jgi:hypothetical protein